MCLLIEYLATWPFSVANITRPHTASVAFPTIKATMTDSSFDPAELSESQQLALGTYTSMTNQEPSAAVPLLRRSEWNVQVQEASALCRKAYSRRLIILQIAIAKFFDGEAPDPVEEARAALSSTPVPAQRSRRENLQNGLASRARSSASSDRELAPRIVPQPLNQTSYRPPFLLSVLFAPFNLLYRILSGPFSFIGYVFPFLPRLLSGLLNRNTPSGSTQNSSGRRPLNARDTAARFVREFEEEYGTHPLQFFEDGYARAHDLAKKELKFLLVVLVSPEHDDTSSFVRGTLLSQEVVNFMNNPQNNILLWAGTVQDSEAYQISTALNCSKFPFAALIAHTPQDSSTSMSVIARISGLLTPSAFVARLRTAISRESAALERVRATQNEQQASRNLREEQNSAYERSLAQDRERARQRRDAEAARVRAEQLEQAKIAAVETEKRNFEQWRAWRAQSIPSEPGADVKVASRLSIRMPSGERIIRKFDAGARMEEVYAFVECHDVLGSGVISTSKPEAYEHIYTFQLVSPMPRQVFGVGSGSIGDSVGRSANLIVESVSEVDDAE